MFPFSKIFLLSIALVLYGGSFAQTIYESPHVKDGKTIQFTFPETFFEVSGIFMEGTEKFTTKPDMLVSELYESGETLPNLTVIHSPAKENSLELMVTMIKERFSISKIIEIETPRLSNMNGRDMMFAAAKGEIDGQKVDAAYFSAIAFGDYNIVVSYSAKEGVDEVMNYTDFKEIILSWKEVETEKENHYMRSAKTPAGYEESQTRDIDTLWENETELYYEGGRGVAIPPPPVPRSVEPPRFANSMFETELEHLDVMADLDDNWGLPILQDWRLLSQFVYKGNRGSVKVFSGGDAANYPSTLEMGMAIQLATGKPGRLEINYDAQISSEDNVFKSYSISGVENSWFYTTVVDGELVFFVVDGESDPDFKKAVRDFMLTMWVENFDEDEELMDEE